MRWKIKSSEKIDGAIIERNVFAFFPISVGDEVRWLEKVTIIGYWYYCSHALEWKWVSKKFLDKKSNKS